MTMHTPGPWAVVEHDHAICVQTESPSKTKYGASRYAAIGGFDRSDRAQLEEARANARLIAAAPDLLEALKDMVGLVELMCPFDGPQQRKARAAIARATGEQP